MPTDSLTTILNSCRQTKILLTDDSTAGSWGEEAAECDWAGLWGCGCERRRRSGFVSAGGGCFVRVEIGWGLGKPEWMWMFAWVFLLAMYTSGTFRFSIRAKKKISPPTQPLLPVDNASVFHHKNC